MKNKKTMIISGMVLAVLIAIGAFALYQYSIGPMNTVVLKVEDTKIRMDYYLKRIMMSAEQQSMPTLQRMMNEQVILMGSRQAPFNISVSEAEIDDHAKELAAIGGDISEAEFAEWYRQQVNESGLTAGEYRELIEVSLVTEKMIEHFRGELEKGVDHVKLNVIMLDSKEAYEAIARGYDNGMSFEDLAAEYSVDSDLAAVGGQFGWMARGELEEDIDQVIFSLEIGELSHLVTLEAGTYGIFMVRDKESDRLPSEEVLAILEKKALEEWVMAAYARYDAELYGLDGIGYDSETDSWVNWQIAKMKEREGL